LPVAAYLPARSTCRDELRSVYDTLEELGKLAPDGDWEEGEREAGESEGISRLHFYVRFAGIVELPQFEQLAVNPWRSCNTGRHWRDCGHFQGLLCGDHCHEASVTLGPVPPKRQRESVGGPGNLISSQNTKGYHRVRNPPYMSQNLEQDAERNLADRWRRRC